MPKALTLQLLDDFVLLLEPAAEDLQNQFNALITNEIQMEANVKKIVVVL